MKKKFLLSVGLLGLGITSCQQPLSPTPSPKHSYKTGRFIYMRTYKDVPLESQIGDANNLNSVTVPTPPLGEKYQDMFTKEPGRAMTSDFSPSELSSSSSL